MPLEAAAPPSALRKPAIWDGRGWGGPPDAVVGVGAFGFVGLGCGGGCGVECVFEFELDGAGEGCVLGGWN